MGKGEGPSSITNVPPAILPPDYPFRVGLMRDVFPNLVGAQMPNFQQAGGQFGGAPSPTQMAANQMAQQWATTGPQFAGGVQGTLGNLSEQTYRPGAADEALNRFLAPSAINPAAEGPSAARPFDIGGAGGGGMGPGAMSGPGPGGGAFTPPGYGANQMAGAAPRLGPEGRDPGGGGPGGGGGGGNGGGGDGGGGDGGGGGGGGGPGPGQPGGPQFPGFPDLANERWKPATSSSGGDDQSWVWPQRHVPTFAGTGMAPYTPLDPGAMYTPWNPGAGMLPMGQGLATGGLWGAGPSHGVTGEQDPGYGEAIRGSGYAHVKPLKPPEGRGKDPDDLPGGGGGGGGGDGGNGGGGGTKPRPGEGGRIPLSRSPEDDMPNQLGTRPYQLPGGAGVGGVGSAGGGLTGMRMPGAGGLNTSSPGGLGAQPGGMPQPAGGAPTAHHMRLDLPPGQTFADLQRPGTLGTPQPGDWQPGMPPPGGALDYQWPTQTQGPGGMTIGSGPAPMPMPLSEMGPPPQFQGPQGPGDQAGAKGGGPEAGPGGAGPGGPPPQPGGPTPGGGPPGGPPPGGPPQGKGGGPGGPGAPPPGPPPGGPPGGQPGKGGGPGGPGGPPPGGPPVVPQGPGPGGMNTTYGGGGGY